MKLCKVYSLQVGTDHITHDRIIYFSVRPTEYLIYIHYNYNYIHVLTSEDVIYKRAIHQFGERRRRNTDISVFPPSGPHLDQRKIVHFKKKFG